MDDLMHKEIVAHIIPQCVSAYVTTMVKELVMVSKAGSSGGSPSGRWIPPEEIREKIHPLAQSMSMTVLANFVGHSNVSKYQDTLFQQLNTKLTSILKENDENLESLLQNSVIIFKNFVQQGMSPHDFYFKDHQLTNALARAKTEAIQSFISMSGQASPPPYAKSFLKIIDTVLPARLRTVKTYFQDQNQEKLTQARNACREKVDELFLMYKEKEVSTQKICQELDTFYFTQNKFPPSFTLEFSKDLKSKMEQLDQVLVGDEDSFIFCKIDAQDDEVNEQRVQQQDDMATQAYTIGHQIEVTSEVNRGEEAMNLGFCTLADQIEDNLDEMEDNLGQQEADLDEMENNFDQIEENLDQIQSNSDQLENNLNKTDQNGGKIEEPAPPNLDPFANQQIDHVQQVTTLEILRSPTPAVPTTKILISILVLVMAFCMSKVIKNVGPPTPNFQIFQKLMSDSIQIFDIKMKKMVPPDHYFDDDLHLHHLCQLGRESVLKYFDEKVKPMAHKFEPDEPSLYRNMLGDLLDQKLEQMKTLNEKNGQIFHTQMSITIDQQMRQIYEDTIDLNSLTKKSLDSHADAAKKAAILYLESKLDFSGVKIDSKSRSKFLETVVREKIPKFYENAVKDFQDRLMIRKLFREHGYDHLKSFYKMEMSKLFDKNVKKFYPPHDLQQIHNELCDKLMEQHLKDFDLSETDRLELTQDLAQLFVEFREQNLQNVNDAHSDIAIGIDLGTTNSVVAYHINGTTRVIESDQGGNLVPSFVYFEPTTEGSDSSKIVVGQVAKANKAFIDPENTVYEAKRLIGRKYDDPIVQSDMKLWPFKLIDENNWPKISIRKKTYRPQDVSAEILKELKKIAEKDLLRPVKNAVITVPAYFNDAQKRATVEAGEAAGLHVLKIIQEPTAAVLAYNLHRSDSFNQNVLVFDLGGGTFDVSVVNLGRGHVSVLAVGGDTHLGGSDFDNNLAAYCLQQFTEKTGLKIPTQVDHMNDQNRRTEILKQRRRLQSKCEDTKIWLSDSTAEEVYLGSFYQGHDLMVRVEREKFENLNMHLFEKCIKIMNQVRQESGLEWDEIDAILLVGGSTRIPAIKKMIKAIYGGTVLENVRRDEAVAQGAAVQAAILNGEYQMKKSLLTISDVTPLSLGIEDSRGRNVIFLPKNSKIPVTVTKTMVTASDYQTMVEFPVYQGEDEVAIENQFLGSFTIHNIPPRPRGQEQFKVKMEMDANGILHVEAINQSDRNRKNGIVIKREDQ